MAQPTSTTKVYLDGKEAEAEMKKLTEESVKLRAAIIKAKKTGDFEGLVKAQDELKKVNGQVKLVERSTRIYNDVLKNLSTASVSDLERAYKELSREVKNATRNTQDYVSKSKQLERVKAELAKVRGETNALTASKRNFFSSAADGFNKYFGFVTTMAASITGLVFSFRQTVQAFNDFEEGAAELSSITGLAGEDLDFLKERAKQLSVSVTEDGVRIKSSAQDILTAFTLMGSAKPELLSNKEALADVTKEALILAEAAKMDTATAVESLANTMNQFGAPAEDARRYINALAAGSKEGAVMISDLSNSMIKVGTVADQANISVEETVALLETLGDKGIKGEIAGTQLRGVLLKLQTGASQFNPAVVGMNVALDNLANANLSVADKVKMFGQENVVAGNILIANRERYKELTAAVTGTNVAIEQAAINTDTANAKLEQARNKVQLNAIALGEKLSPALTFSTNAFNQLLTVLVQFLGWAERNASLVAFLAKLFGVLTVSVVSYVAAKRLAAMWTNNYVRASIIEVAMEKLKTAQMIIARGATFAYAAAKALLSGNIQKATIAMRAFSIATKTSPIGILVGLVTAAATAFVLFNNRSKEANQTKEDAIALQDQWAKKQAEELGAATSLFEALKNTNSESKRRDELIKEINSKYGTTLKNLKDEKAFLDQVADAHKSVMDSIKRKLAVQAQEDSLRVNAENRFKYEIESAKIQEQIAKKQAELSKTLNGVPLYAKNDLRRLQIEAEIESLKSNAAAYEEMIRISDGSFTDMYKRTQKIIDGFGEATGEAGNNSAGSVKKATDENLKLLQEYQKKVSTQLMMLEAEKKSANQRELDDIRQKYNEDLLMAEQMRVKDAKRAEEWKAISDELILNRNEELLRKRQEQEMRWEAALLAAKKEFGKLSAQELLNLELEALDAQFAAKEISEEEYELRWKETQLKHQRDRAETIRSAREKFGLISDAEKEAKELEDLKAVRLQGLISEEEYITARSAIWAKFAKQRQEADQTAWNEQLKGIEAYFQNASLYINAFSNLFSAAKQLELDEAEENEEKKKAINKKYADIEMGIKIAQIAASTALAIMQGFAQLGPIGGAIAAAVVGITGGIQIAAAVKERNRIRGFEEGYYGDVTDHRGRKYKARAGGYPRTQKVDKPTVFLAGEQGASFPEMIIDGSTFRNLQINAPEAIDAIYAARDGVKGFEEGYYPGRETVIRESSTQTMFTDPELKRLLNSLLMDGVKARVVYREIEDIREKENNIKAKFR